MGNRARQLKKRQKDLLPETEKEEKVMKKKSLKKNNIFVKSKFMSM